MFKKLLIVGAGIVAGMFAGYFLISETRILDNLLSKPISNPFRQVSEDKKPNKKQVVGFLPFWLVDKAQSDYSEQITQLSYFNLVIDSDGSIQKFTSPGESDPGYRSLTLGKVDSFLNDQKSKGVELSLTIFSGDDKKINAFLEDPIKSADNLTNDINPILSQYGFKDLNLDIEKVADTSPDQRQRYTEFVRQVRKNLDPSIKISLDVVSTSFVKDTNLCDPKALGEIVDYIIIMGYDFHNPSSSVTGSLAPQSGAGIVNEFDIESAVQAAKTQVPSEKLILAVPLYGYSWETIGNFPRAAVMPGSAFSISSRSVKELLESEECANCKPQFDGVDSENYIIYENVDTGLYHQIFYPDIKSTQVKIDFAKSQNLGGIALWALGYEDNEILEPLRDYIKESN